MAFYEPYAPEITKYTVITDIDLPGSKTVVIDFVGKVILFEFDSILTPHSGAHGSFLSLILQLAFPIPQVRYTQHIPCNNTMVQQCSPVSGGACCGVSDYR
jgi:hypothetical protein